MSVCDNCRVMGGQLRISTSIGWRNIRRHAKDSNWVSESLPSIAPCSSPAPII